MREFHGLSLERIERLGDMEIAWLLDQWKPGTAAASHEDGKPQQESRVVDARGVFDFNQRARAEREGKPQPTAADLDAAWRGYRDSVKKKVADVKRNNEAAVAAAKKPKTEGADTAGAGAPQEAKDMASMQRRPQRDRVTVCNAETEAKAAKALQASQAAKATKRKAAKTAAAPEMLPLPAQETPVMEAEDNEPGTRSEGHSVASGDGEPAAEAEGVGE